MSDLPNVAPGAFEVPSFARLTAADMQHKPRILMLYGSLRERSYSRFLTFEAQRLLEAFGAEVRVFHANGLLLPNDAHSFASAGDRDVVLAQLTAPLAAEPSTLTS